MIKILVVLQKLNITNKLQRIRNINSAFKGCEKLARISIPSTITTIGNNAFGTSVGIEITYKCTTEITIDKPKASVLGAPWGVSSPGKVIWSDGETAGVEQND